MTTARMAVIVTHDGRTHGRSLQFGAHFLITGVMHRALMHVY